MHDMPFYADPPETVQQVIDFPITPVSDGPPVVVQERELQENMLIPSSTANIVTWQGLTQENSATTLPAISHLDVSI